MKKGVLTISEEVVQETKTIQKVNQEQIHDILFNREIGWQEIIYDLINTEQLDPWDVDIVVLTERFLEKIQVLEEADFFVSSKVLYAAALLLRIKSEILLNDHIKSIDDILFGKKEEPKKYDFESIELDEEIPNIVPKTPMPRFKRVTLKELMESLNKAITTENRRIKKEIVKSNALRETSISLPKKTISIKDRIKEVYEKLRKYFQDNEGENKVSFKSFIGDNRDEQIISFYPLLQLDNQKKVWLEQEVHLVDFHIWLKHVYLKHNPDPFADLRELEKEVEKKIEELDDEKKKRIEEINKDFENPLGELFD
jgi:segregation and condensation protein A